MSASVCALSGIIVANVYQSIFINSNYVVKVNHNGLSAFSLVLDIRKEAFIEFEAQFFLFFMVKILS